MPRSTIAFIAVSLLLCVVVAWRLIEGAQSSVQLSFAHEQTEIFNSMADNAAECLRQSPPVVHAAVGHLKYVHTYYPSGTKQTEGSRLDRIVERTRPLAELWIIQMLRDATGQGLGDNAEVWINEFGDEADAQHHGAATLPTANNLCIASAVAPQIE